MIIVEWLFDSLVYVVVSLPVRLVRWLGRMRPNQVNDDDVP